MSKLKKWRNDKDGKNQDYIKKLDPEWGWLAKAYKGHRRINK